SVEGPGEIDNLQALLALGVQGRNRNDAGTICTRRNRLRRLQETTFRETLGLFRADAQAPSGDFGRQIVYRRGPLKGRKPCERNRGSNHETGPRSGGSALGVASTTFANYFE